MGTAWDFPLVACLGGARGAIPAGDLLPGSPPGSGN